MNRLYKLIALGVLSAMTLTACSSAESGASDEVEKNSEEKIIQDQLGRDVAIPENTERIVVGGILPYFSTWYVGTNSTEEVVGLHPNAYNAAENSMLANISPEILNASTEFVK